LSAASELAATDPVMARLVQTFGELSLPERPKDVYGALLRAIVGQQLSVKAANAIYGRLLGRYGGRGPTPSEVLAEDPDSLRVAVGLSHAKVSYLRSLAEHVESGSLELDRLTELDDDAVIAELTAVKGIGTWSAHMFLMFTLGRPDVLAPGDLGIRRAIERLYGFEGLPSEAEVVEVGEKWRPHRTLACRYLWASLANAPVGA
jgi:DNA-3-methyladenine glycosylase II